MTSCELKYEPKSINDVVFNNPHYENKIKLIFQGFKTRHLFFSGSNGSGKTTLANLIAHNLTNHCPYLNLNESIETIMDQDDLYAYFMRIYNTARFSGSVEGDRIVVIFNELDKFKGSLDRLWTVMDRMKDELLIIITTNAPLIFENAIRSRCEKFNFTRITPEQFLARAQYILRQEQLILPDSHVLHYLNSMTIKTSDVRDYLSVLDQLIFMHQNGVALPATPYSNIKPTIRPSLSVIK